MEAANISVKGLRLPQTTPHRIWNDRLLLLSDSTAITLLALHHVLIVTDHDVLGLHFHFYWILIDNIFWLLSRGDHLLNHKVLRIGWFLMQILRHHYMFGPRRKVADG